MRRRGSGLLTIILIGLLGYCAWQLYSLKREVAVLKADIASLKAEQKGGVAGSTDSLSYLAQAKDHAEQAKRHLLSGDAKRARDELEKSFKLLDQAFRKIDSPASGASDKILSLLRETRDNVERLWKRLDTKSNDSKGE